MKIEFVPDKEFTDRIEIGQLEEIWKIGQAEPGNNTPDKKQI